MILSKVCTKCGVEKPVEEFPVRESSKNWYRRECKVCCAAYHAQYHLLNYEKNKDKYKEKAQLWRQANVEKRNTTRRIWRKANPEKMKAEYLSQKAKLTKEKLAEKAVYAATWRKENLERTRETYKRNGVKKRATIQGRLRSNITRSINHALKGNKHGRHWETVVGFTLQQLKDHIEKQFIKDMSWEEYMKGGIHLDHKTPVSAFNFSTPDDIGFKECFSLNNLQPLWKAENLQKHNKLEWIRF